MRHWLTLAAVLPAVALLSGASTPQPKPRFRAGPSKLVELPVRIDGIGVLRFDRHGNTIVNTSLTPSPTPPLFGTDGPGCDRQSTLEATNFQTGTYHQQAGLAQGEWLCATYNLTQYDFPLQIELIEAMFAVNGTTVQTTTRYTVGVWDGTPTQGTMIFSSSSSDQPGDFPNLIMPPGTSATIIQASIDPGDPDQIFVYDTSGSHKVTIGIRIDHHNAQSGSGCINSAPPYDLQIPVARNAFPLTDNNQTSNYSQLNFPSQNWLFGINCTPELGTSCPEPNGGWSNFASLSTSCRPHGDWMLRATWKRTNCQPGVGAACKPDGTCAIVLATDAQTNNWLYRGDGSVCAEANCPIPTGACCFSNGFCTVLQQAQCTGIPGSTYRGHGTVCGANSTCPPPTNTCRADIATEGNPDPLSGPDGFVTGVDFDVFVQAYFTALRRANNELVADMTDSLGTGNPDGFLTGTDFDKFVQLYFAGC